MYYLSRPSEADAWAKSKAKLLGAHSQTRWVSVRCAHPLPGGSERPRRCARGAQPRSKMFHWDLGSLVASRQIPPSRGLLATVFQTLPGAGRGVELTAPPPCATKSMDINSPALVLLRGMLPASPPPAPPGKVILGWRDDNRICICRLPSNFLMGASRKRTSCAVPLRSTSGDLEGDNHELLSGKTKKWKNSLGAAALSHCISRGPTVCVPPPGCQRDCLVYLKEPLTPHLIVRMCPSPNRFHLSVKRCHVHQAFLG